MRKLISQISFLEPTLLVYSIWHCRSILDAWRTSPYDAGGEYIFLIWMAPCLLLFASTRRQRFNHVLLLAGIISTFGGHLTSLHFLSYIGLTFVLAGIFCPRPSNWIGLTGSFSWQPVSGWALSHFINPGSAFFLCVFLSSGSGISLFWEPRP